MSRVAAAGWWVPAFACALAMPVAVTPVAAAGKAPRSAPRAGAHLPAEVLYEHGRIYTVDAVHPWASALAVADGRIAWVGDDADAAAWAGPHTRRVDLGGRFLMPGLVDAHMHPQSGGLRMLRCSLDYQPLTIAQFQARIRACLEAQPRAGDGEWLQVINWFEQAAQPAGTVLDRGVLDALPTRRPIQVHSTYGHTDLVNSRALELAGVTRDTPDPKDGVIVRDAAGEPTGLLEEAAKDLVDRLVPEPTPEENLRATRLALEAMRRHGITSFLDAYTDDGTLRSYRALQQQAELTARAHFAVLIDSVPGYDAAGAVAGVLAARREFDQGPPRPAPSLQVDTAKLFLDGVYSMPSYTGAMLQPYFEDRGPPGQPDWRPGGRRGVEPYFTPAQLADTLARLAAAGIDPHMHADGDGAVRAALDGIEAMRKAHPGAGVRPAIAHAEIMHPDDYPRLAQLDAVAVLSFQWQKPAPDLNARDSQYLGPVRVALAEPAGLLAQHGARIAYGSDWPVDPLDPWLALQVAVTRTAVGDDAVRFPGRLGIDPGLTLAQALRAITLDAAWSLRQDDVTGSLEPGKFADFVVLDRNPFETAPDALREVRTLLAVVGGRVVFREDYFRGL